MDIVPITVAGEMLITAIAAILAGGLVAPVNVPLVNLAKYILNLVGLEGHVSGNVLSLVVAAGITIAVWLSRHFGVELQLTTVFDWLTLAIPMVLSGLAMFFGQKATFAYMQKHDVPLFGYTRSK